MQRPIVEVTTQSLDAYKYYIMGNESMAAWDFNKAKENYLKAIDLDSTFAMAHINLAYLYKYLRSLKKMEIHIDKAMKYKDKLTYREQILFDYSYVELKGLDRSESISVLKKATSLYPKEKQIFSILGFYYSYTKREPDSAITFYQKVLGLDPYNKTAINQLGYRYLYNKKDYAKALEFFQRYADVVPDEHNPYDSMGEVYLKMNNHTKSIEMYEKAIKIKPDYLNAYIGVASNLIKMKEYQKARDYLNQWYNADTIIFNLERIYSCMAASYIAEGKPENAVIDMTELCDIAEQKSEIFSLAGNTINTSEIYYEYGRLKEAEEYLDKGMEFVEFSDLAESEKDGLLISYYWHLSRLEVKKSNIKSAKRSADMYKYFAMNGRAYQQKMFHGLIALIEYAEGHYQKALSELEQSEFENPFVFYHMALTYLQMGNKDKAIEKLESAIRFSDFAKITDEIMRDHAQKLLVNLKSPKTK